jgi:ATP-dependent helicase/nuclease subunit A
MTEPRRPNAVQASLFDAIEKEEPLVDQAARDFAIDPANDVVLEASAGTGKTRVLVDRYLRLIEEDVDPRHILAMTFTRQAAAEMRDRILVELRRRAALGGRMAARWDALRERVPDIQISTIDAFCYGLLREFPLEARVDPGFEIADETEIARLTSEALDRTLRVARRLIATDEHVRLLFTKVRLPSLRDSLQSLIDRRHVALPALATFVARVRCQTAGDAATAFVSRVAGLVGSPAGRAILNDGPDASPEFCWLKGDLLHLDDVQPHELGRVQQLQRRLERYFLTDKREPRQKAAKRFGRLFASPDAKRRHELAIRELAPRVRDAIESLAVDVNGLLSRGLQRVFVIAADIYERVLDEHTAVDFAGMLARAVALLGQQEEFARSRLKLQSRYHHVLVDEFQDTSRLQWRLIELLIDAWGEGQGPEDAPTSIFVVGDRKQSIYRFRHAEVTLLDEVARKVTALRLGRTVRQSITHSFRAVPELLAFVNSLASELQDRSDPQGQALEDAFAYGDSDRFPVAGVQPGARRDGKPVLGIVAERSMEACAQAVAAEVERLVGRATVRDRKGSRLAQPGDIAILFRARAGHRYFEEALEARGIPSFVYKGLGFFDAPEVQDLQSLIRYLARPESNLRAAELLRSRIARLSDVALARLAPDLSGALRSPVFDPSAAGLDDIDATLLTRARSGLAGWLELADRVTPSELIDRVLQESAYVFELGGRRLQQARENLKKMLALVRRIENRGYPTLDRLAAYLDRLKSSDESNAVIEESGSVNLMTIHAAKGLEFPIVFVVNLHVAGRGRSSAFSVIERGPDGGPEVAFGSSAATKLEDRREREELRRLLYVSVTRARDRLVLAGEVDEQNRLRKGARSLGSLLPDSLADLFRQASMATGDAVDWTSGSGRFAFEICRPGHDLAPATSRVAEPERVPDVAWIAAGRRVVSATGEPEESRSPSVGVIDAAAPTDRLIGTAVHRLFQRRTASQLSHSDVMKLVPRVLRPEELVDAGDVEALSSRAAGLFCRLRERADVRELVESGTCQYEVPFSFCPADRPDDVVRGRIDCLVTRPDGNLTVLEFKTGQRRPEHEDQVAIYRAALSALVPDRQVEVCIVYP